MKKLSKVLVLVLSAIMVLAMSASVFAATTVTIDPKTPATGATNTPEYTYYVMMKASVGEAAEGQKAPTSYYVETEALATAIDGLKIGEDDLFTVTKAAGADRWNVTINEKYKDAGEDVAAALATIKSSAIATGKATNNQITLDYDAYLLIESSLGTKLVLDTVNTKTVNEKNSYPGVLKTEDKSNAEIGQVITYTVPVSIPATVAEKPIVVTDTMTKGLTMNTAITADQGVTGLVWTLDSTDSATQAKTYKVTIPAATVKANAGKTITLTYTATVNELAVVNTPEINTAKLDYDNFTTVETEPVEVKTFGFDLKKIGDGNQNNPLANVKFTLQNSANEYYTLPSDDASVDEDRFVAAKSEVSTDAQGAISFEGLAQGVYTLTETATVDGYNLLAGPITVTIDANGDATFSGAGAEQLEGNSVVINNESGAELPATGGIGTTIFYVLGTLLVVGCGIVLVSRKRMEKNN